MSSHGIRDRVAIVGMGCTNFGEHWDKGLDDLIMDAASEAFKSAAVTKEQVDAYWFGTAQKRDERHHPVETSPGEMVSFVSVVGSERG